MTIFNLCFSTGTFPEVLKIAKVLPVYKQKGSVTESNNYRPISLLSNMDKVLEKLIYKRTYCFLSRFKILYTNQFGFRRNHSTFHTLASMCQKITDALDKGEHVCGVFVDLQKAFDTVDHEILLAKLQHYGIRDKAFSLFKSYLSDRRQFVTISGRNSAEAIIRHGVPQGSVLGPLLFLIYINDLNHAICHSAVHHFADDTNLLCVSSTLESLVKMLNLDLKFLWHWLNANKISLNASKTEYLLFRHPNRKYDQLVKLKIGGKRIFESKTIKYLGVHMDSDLKWKTQVNNVAVKLKKANGVLGKLRHYMPLKIRMLVYHALFSSHLTYCSQVWGQHVENVSLAEMDRIRRLQNIALRLVTFSHYRAHASQLYSFVNVLKFCDVIDRQNVLFLHDIYNSILPPAVIETFNVDFLHAYNTRANTYGLINSELKNTTTYGTGSLKHQSILSWNKCQKLKPESKFYDLSRSELEKLLTTTLTSVY